MRKARLIRQSRKLSLEDVVRRTSIGVAHLGRFERGIAGLSISKLLELARLYQVSVDELLAEVDGHDLTAGEC